MSKREPQEFNYKNGRGTIYFPDISDEERDRRHKELERATILLLREVQRADAAKGEKA
ncbi:MAG: hypothetical protein VB119_09865 [Candidatus Metalachnospira sp.]|nr:hypothetical protein [Candidatus Metalachnospira sp.]